MSHLANQDLEANLYEQYIDELEKKYFGGVNSIGEPWFTKSQPEMEGEAKKEVEEFITRNS
tara:strand:+ start:344 stop:526 length:183 start_codon:yes stop_codon:yes gene_type:complete